MRDPNPDLHSYDPRITCLPLLQVAGIVGLLVGAASGSAAALDRLGEANFEPATEVVAGLDALPTSAGDIATYAFGEWHVLYAQGGAIYRVRRDPVEGWGVPETVSTGAAVSASNPQVCALGEVHVVWEDDRSGQTEVWTRRWDGAVWSAEECLTPGGAVSSGPVIARRFTDAFLVWAEGDVGSRAVLGRNYDGVWGTVESISFSSGDAYDPALSTSYWISWTDDQIGEERILFRRRTGTNSYGPIRLVNTVYPARRSCLGRQRSGGDAAANPTMIFYELDEPGGTEIWAAFVGDDEIVSSTQRISSSDGIPSTLPSLSSFTSTFSHLLESSVPWWFVTWTNEDPNGVSHEVAVFSSYGSEPLLVDEAALSNEGEQHSRFSYGYEAPYSQLAAFWVEDQGDGPALWAQLGSQRSCVLLDLYAPDAMIATPAGAHRNPVDFVNLCGGTSGAVDSATVELRSDVRTGLNWFGDPPPASYVLPVDPDTGELPLYFEAGGCVEASGGLGVLVKLSGVTVLAYPGVRSPDVNGDCVVDYADRAYVESRLGGDDFCADIDGSGVVDELDLAFVDMTLGENCGSLSSTPPPTHGLSAGPGMEVAPNPTSSGTVIRLRRAGDGTVPIDVIDVSGRIVRKMRGAPGETELEWDLLDDGRRPVPAGVYWVRAQTPNGTVRTGVTVLR